MIRVAGDTLAIAPPLIVSEAQIGEIFEKTARVIGRWHRFLRTHTLVPAALRRRSGWEPREPANRAGLRRRGACGHWYAPRRIVFAAA